MLSRLKAHRPISPAIDPLSSNQCVGSSLQVEAPMKIGSCG
jgi:hypothetical protein